MKMLLGKSWKTSLTGYAIAGGYAALTVMSGGTFAAKDLLIAIGMAVLGRFSKDAGVSGFDI